MSEYVLADHKIQPCRNRDYMERGDTNGQAFRCRQYCTVARIILINSKFAPEHPFVCAVTGDADMTEKNTLVNPLKTKGEQLRHLVLRDMSNNVKVEIFNIVGNRSPHLSDIPVIAVRAVV